MKHPIAAVLALALAAAMPHAANAADKQAAEPQMNAQMQAMMQAMEKAGTPGAQHKQLAEQFAGTWTTKQTMLMDPSAPPMVETGKAVNTSVLGGRQLRMDFTGQAMGQPFEGVGYSGYDNMSGKYISSWTDSMSTGIMMSSGDYDAASKTYTYRGDMPDMAKPGAMVPVRSTVRVVDPDHHVMEWFETRDGKEAKTMVIEYARAK